MSKVYTKTGDRNITCLSDNTLVKKTSLQIEVCGTIDELIAHIENLSIVSLYKDNLSSIVKDLSAICLDVSRKPHPAKEFDVYNKIRDLELLIDRFGSNFKGFKSPNTEAASRSNICRVVARRLERVYLRWSETLYEEQQNKLVQIYLNRLSDLFYSLMLKFNES